MALFYLGLYFILGLFLCLIFLISQLISIRRLGLLGSLTELQILGNFFPRIFEPSLAIPNPSPCPAEGYFWSERISGNVFSLAILSFSEVLQTCYSLPHTNLIPQRVPQSDADCIGSVKFLLSFTLFSYLFLVCQMLGMDIS